MNLSDILGRTTEELEAMTDAQLVAELGPDIEKCRPKYQEFASSSTKSSSTESSTTTKPTTPTPKKQSKQELMAEMLAFAQKNGMQVNLGAGIPTKTQP